MSFCNITPSGISNALCNVIPFTLPAATPVGAQTNTFLCFALISDMYLFIRNDLPTPAPPVKNTLLPEQSILYPAICSLLSAYVLSIKAVSSQLNKIFNIYFL